MTSLTPDDKTVMGRARTLAACVGDNAFRTWFRSQGNTAVANSDTTFLYGSAVGAAQQYLTDLLGTLERVAGHPYPADGGVVLSAADMATVRAALVDAAAWRGDVGYCSDCDALPDGYLCGDHHGDEELTVSYTELLTRIGGPR